MYFYTKPRNYLSPTKVDRERFQLLQATYWSEQSGKPVFSADEHGLLKWYFCQDRTERPYICVKEEPRLKTFPATPEQIDWTLGNSLYRLLNYDRGISSGFVAALPTDQPSAASP